MRGANEEFRSLELDELDSVIGGADKGTVLWNGFGVKLTLFTDRPTEAVGLNVTSTSTGEQGALFYPGHT